MNLLGAGQCGAWTVELWVRACTSGKTEGREERARCSVTLLGDATSYGKALACVHTQTLVTLQHTGNAAALCMFPVAIQ